MAKASWDPTALLGDVARLHMKIHCKMTWCFQAFQCLSSCSSWGIWPQPATHHEAQELHSLLTTCTVCESQIGCSAGKSSVSKVSRSGFSGDVITGKSSMSMTFFHASKFSFLLVWKPWCRHCLDFKANFMHKCISSPNPASRISLQSLALLAVIRPNTRSAPATAPLQSPWCLDAPCIPFGCHTCPGIFAQVCFEDVG